MTDISKLRKVIDTCDGIILQRFPGLDVLRDARAESLEFRMSHLRWMLLECRAMIDKFKTDRAFQWLGFVQGYLCSEGFVTIQELQLIDILGHLPTDEEKDVEPV